MALVVAVDLRGLPIMPAEEERMVFCVAVAVEVRRMTLGIFGCACSTKCSFHYRRIRCLYEVLLC